MPKTSYWCALPMCGVTVFASKMPSRQAAHAFAFLFSFLVPSFPVPVAPRCCNTKQRSHLGFAAAEFDRLLFVVLARAVGDLRRVTEIPRLTESEGHWRGIRARKMVIQRDLSHSSSLARVPEPRHVSIPAGHRRSQPCAGDARCRAATCIDPVRGLKSEVGRARPVPVTDGPPAPCLSRTPPGRHFG